MLLIGDIHITTRVKEAILDQLRTFVAGHPEEQHIIFVGDYVYHFAYDRGASLALYSFFIELFEQGKTVYVLAGNHDWLTDNFVYAEAKKAFDILHGAHHNKLYFITEPMQCVIEGQNVLFLPYMLSPQSLQDVAQTNIGVAWQDEVRVLTQSSHKHEVMSGLLTNYILQSYSSSPELLVIFHHYLANTRLPGQQSTFYYKDVALHPGLLDLPGLRLLSGHVHHVCSYKNYIGIGSVRHTSPLEVQEVKGLFCLQPSGVMTMQPVMIYPYVQIHELEGLDRQKIQGLLEDIWQTIQTYFVSSVWDMTFGSLPVVDMKQLSITILRDDVSYDQLSQILSSDIVESARDIKIKKDAVAMQDLLSDFSAQQDNLQTGFADWKAILKAYIDKKYPENVDVYLQLLQDMKLL